MAASVRRLAPPAAAVPLSAARERQRTRAMVADVHRLLGTSAGRELAWLPALRRVNPALAADLERRAFRPPRPTAWRARPNTWLSELDIRAVMRQYDGVRGFRFVGTFPRDFAAPDPDAPRRCVSAPMCALSVAGLRRAGTPRVGVVFNMDTHDQSGSHWVAAYVCVDPRDRTRFGAWYYDSVANPPPREIAAFLTRMADEARAEFAPATAARFRVAHNVTQRQFKNTECGVYACLFLVACLTTRRPFEDVCATVMQRDAKVAELRHVFFRDAV